MLSGRWKSKSLVPGLVLAAIAALTVLAPTASATLRVESTNRGLVMTDLNGTFNDFVQLRLRLGSGIAGLPEWEIEKSGVCGFPCLDLIKYEFGSGCRADGDFARCDRLGGGVRAVLKGGNDTLSIFGSPLPITDPMVLDMGAGNDFADGSLGNDTLLGGPGDDGLRGEAGNDVMNGGDGDDILTLGVGADIADGGAGSDFIGVGTPERDETDQVNGGLGADRITYSGRLTPVRIIEANLQSLGGEKDTNENDVLISIERYDAGEGKDIITGVLSSNAGIYHGLNDDDQLFGTSGANTLIGGGGNDLLSSKAGNDIIDAKGGEISTSAHTDATIDCGEGTTDLAILDLTDDKTPAGCENVTRSALGEGPNVLMTLPRLVPVVDGRVGARLTCPRKLTRRCIGTLELRIGARRTTRASYSIRPGNSARVRVTLGPLAGRIGTRTIGKLISRELGKIGPKTTERRIVLSR